MFSSVFLILYNTGTGRDQWPSSEAFSLASFWDKIQGVEKALCVLERAKEAIP